MKKVANIYKIFINLKVQIVVQKQIRKWKADNQTSK